MAATGVFCFGGGAGVRYFMNSEHTHAFAPVVKFVLRDHWASTAFRCTIAKGRNSATSSVQLLFCFRAAARTEVFLSLEP